MDAKKMLYELLKEARDELLTALTNMDKAHVDKLVEEILAHEKALKEITAEQLAIESSGGWFWSEKFRVHQKVNKEVYVYVSKLLFGWNAQCYLRGDVTMCTLEARTSDMSPDGFEKMIAIGEEWLEKYGENVDLIKEDFFHIDGEAWNNGKKEFWI